MTKFDENVKGLFSCTSAESGGVLPVTTLTTSGVRFSSFLFSSSPPYKLSNKAAASFRIFEGMSKSAFIALSKSVVADEVCGD